MIVWIYHKERGDHFIYWKNGIDEIINLQPDGDTPAKALENVDKIIADWLATARELGREIPVPQGRLAVI